ncbi:hypothetical protein M407DRAFT_11775 [Tulasnella calospora MUT 4182]|uniref:BTB domain-containing protein n=1 Tax=Tulasnella calospora MUT 4182 TaxID=1051891 RepID=A0A0C3PUT2_9AGAM|nr:hypothetical protein M407DRAFT_11775 [Tulasnella calospora MUT 4182]
MFSDSDSDCEGYIGGLGWLDTRTPVIIEGARYFKDRNHWYDDGNIILVVHTTAFRVFQSILTEHSQVMKDMLGIPQPTAADGTNGSISEGQPSFEGVPVVMLDDKDYYFQLLLDALLPNDTTNPAISGNIHVNYLMGVAQIAKKYEFDDVATHVISLLENRLPTVEQPRINLGYSLSYDMQDYVRIIKWARRCGLPQFLPLCFYHLATAEWDEFQDEDQFLETQRAFQKLSPQDQWRTYIGRGKLQALILEVGLSAQWEDCQNNGCRMTRNGPSDQMGARHQRLKFFLLNPLQELKRREWRGFVPDLCDGCSELFASWNQSAKDRILGQLGTCFTIADEKSEFGGCP